MVANKPVELLPSIDLTVVHVNNVHNSQMHNQIYNQLKKNQNKQRSE